MRVPLAWLREHCDPGLPAAELAQRLTLTGTKVERIERHGVGAPDAFVVGRVLEVSPHPDADRLRVCRVALDGDGGEVAQIVCGAPNVAAGQTVAVARPGAVMPDGTELGRARLRGVDSEGMILAEDELAIGSDHAGILDLDGAAPAGTPLAQVIEIAGDVLELEITPNRPDCLGVYGVAREVHAATGAPLGVAPWESDPGAGGPEEIAGVGVEVLCPELCPRFEARLFEGIALGPSPPWLKARLSAAGQRPISNVVDVTNYVMLLCGHPLHAFDADRIEGGRLVVRRAREGETLSTLDGVERTLDGEMVVICDGQGPTSLAGVMGGERSEVGPSTTRVLLEAATWSADNILGTSNRLALRSEASARFEKGLSPEGAHEAMAVATALLVEVCGARLAPGTIDVGGPGPEPLTLTLGAERMGRLLGRDVGSQRSGEILAALGFGVAPSPEGLRATVPHFRRHDVTREIDLIEEVARVDGVERLPSTLPSRRGAHGRLSHAQRVRRRAEDTLVGAGLSEVVGWSLTHADVAARLRLGQGDPRAAPVALRNPMSEEQAFMRTLLLGSLLDAARHNIARGREAVSLFESGAVYVAGEEALPAESHHLGAVLLGALRPAGWRTPGVASDYFAARAVADAVLGALGVTAGYAARSEPFLAPGRAATVTVGGEELGWVGEVHPLVARTWDLEGRVAALELDLDALARRAEAVPGFRDLISFPAVHQDLAVVVDEGVPAARVLEVVGGAAGALLERAEVFDVYRGEQAGEGRVSLALRLSFRAADRTLTDDEVAVVRERIVAALAGEVGGSIRA